jgi:hypothetical protein
MKNRGFLNLGISFVRAHPAAGEKHFVFENVCFKRRHATHELP